MLANDVFEHDSNRGPYGENLAWRWTSNSSDDLYWTTARAVDAWYDEVYDPGYNFNNPGTSSGTGHFTQVVWKDSCRVGCGIAGFGEQYVVCRYDPPGNFRGRYDT